MNTVDDVDEETFLETKGFLELLKENLAIWKDIEHENNMEEFYSQNNIWWTDAISQISTLFFSYANNY